VTASTHSRLRILYVCSFWSGHARAIVEYFARRSEDFEVTVVSSDAARPMEGVRLFAPERDGPTRSRAVLSWFAERWMTYLSVPDWLWRRVTDARFRHEARVLRQRVLDAAASHPPDLLHALRTQPEGLAALAVKKSRPDLPFALWVWGQDFALVARHSEAMFQATREVVRSVDLLIPDNERDLRLARESFGLSPDAVVRVLPVTCGLDPTELDEGSDRPMELSGDPILLSMRGYESSYVRIRVLIEALARFRERHPRARLYVLAAQGTVDARRDRVIQRWAESHGVGEAVEILHPGRNELFDILRGADLYVSATLCDGLPISLLEALYFGMIPVVFDHESTRPLLRRIPDGVTFDVIDASSVVSAWERAVPLIAGRAERILRNRTLLADGGFYRAGNLASLAKLYRDTVGFG